MIAIGQATVRWVFGFLLCGAVTTLTLHGQGTPTFTNPTVHDPSVVRDGATFYVFGSHLASASTTDLMNWTQVTRDWNAVSNPTNALIRNNSPQAEFAEALAYTVPPAFWAPDVIKLGDGRYYLYYCVCNNTSKSALGLAVSNAITGPYANVGIMLKSGMAGVSPDGTNYNNAVHPNVVDPAVFHDRAGKLWMVYGSYSGGIFILSLDPGTGQPFAGQAYGKKLVGGNNARIEGSYIIYSPESEYYFLFLSFGGLDSTGGYNIRLGRSRNPDGPFLDTAGNDLINAKGAPGTVFDDASIAPYGVKLMGNYQFLHVAGEPQTLSRGYVSPGHNSAYYDPATGKYFLVFHTRFVGRGEVHEVRVHQMFLSEDGWLVVAPQRYAQETVTTTVANRVVGDYKLINHGKAISSAVNTSVPITLNADFSVTGSVSGSWRLSGDHYATLTLSGTSYRGVFTRQWDDDNQVWVRAFSALSANGVSVWGSKVASLTLNELPIILAHPASRTISPNTTAVFSATALDATSYQWRKNGVALVGATSATLVLPGATAANAGDYTCIATNPSGSVTSSAATLALSATPDFGRIINLSILTSLSSGEGLFTVGTVIGGAGTFGPKPLLVRAAGPTLGAAPFNIPGVLPDPKLELYSGSTVIDANDNWAGATALTNAFTAVGAFPYASAASKDAAYFNPALAAGSYTIQVRDTAAATGTVIAELYDATPTASFTATTPRLVNVSVLKQIPAGATLTAGFVIGGATAKTVLIRVVGPTLGLAPFTIPGVLADPKLDLFSGQTVIASNDNWGGDAQIAAAGTAVGAFAMSSAASKDAILLVTLPPGAYTAQAGSVAGTGGLALIEVYEVP